MKTQLVALCVLFCIPLHQSRAALGQTADEIKAAYGSPAGLLAWLTGKKEQKPEPPATELLVYAPSILRNFINGKDTLNVRVQFWNKRSCHEALFVHPTSRLSTEFCMAIFDANGGRANWVPLGTGPSLYSKHPETSPLDDYFLRVDGQAVACWIADRWAMEVAGLDWALQQPQWARIGPMIRQALWSQAPQQAGGVNQDQSHTATAAANFRVAAEQGDALAQCSLGYCYQSGDGVPKDMAEAVKWYRKAAEQGYSQAQNNLGDCYYRGDGVAKDMVEGVKWCRKAAEQGNAHAQSNLGYYLLKGEGVPKDEVEGVKWCRKSAEQGFAGGQYNFACCYEFAHGIPKDMVEAVKWYRQAAEQGHALAQNNLGDCYAKGDGVAKDMAEAVKWYRKAAVQGNAFGQNSLGACYERGEGVPKDEVEALAWLNLAASSGNEAAVKARDDLEKSLGRENTLKAQQRSRELLKTIKPPQ